MKGEKLKAECSRVTNSLCLLHSTLKTLGLNGGDFQIFPACQNRRSSVVLGAIVSWILIINAGNIPQKQEITRELQFV